MISRTIEQLHAELAAFLRDKTSQRWNWIDHNGTKITNPKIENGVGTADGDHPELLILEALVGTNRRWAARRSAAAKKAAVTRAERVEKLVYQEANALLAGRGFRPGLRCWICGKKITDEQSKSRGIGSDCWQRVLQITQALGAEHVFKPREPSVFEVLRLEIERATQ